MKYRLLDLLQCPCGSNKLFLEDVRTKQVPFADRLSKVRCKETCAFRKCSVAQGNLKATDCMECYGQEITEGLIRCQCGEQWPIVGGIPRFLPKELAAEFRSTQATFSYEWKMFHFGERNWGQSIEERKGIFLQAMNTTPGDLKGKLIFDAGCGSGLLSMAMANDFRMEVVALDLAFGIEQAYGKNNNPYLYFLQGSVLAPPVRKEAFDYLYCAGVLVALPDTRRGFKAIIPTLKRGGRCFIWVYHPVTPTYHPHDLRKMRAYNWIRVHFTSRLPIKFQYCLYLSLMPAFLLKQAIGKVFGRKQDLRTSREKMQALFDFFSPIYQNRHEPNEIMEWYSKEGLTEINVSRKGPWGFGVRGDSPAVAPVPGEALGGDIPLATGELARHARDYADL